MAVGLTIDSQSLDLDGAWKHGPSLGRLWGASRYRGQNRIIPDATGRLAVPHILDEVVVDLDLRVYGTNDETGTPHADAEIGLSDNIIFLREFVEGLTSTATVTAELETPGSRTFEAEVQVLNLQVAQYTQTVPVAYLTYDLRIPAGTWTETTPP